jgi:agmatinase
MSVLYLDAHYDLRDSYRDSKFNHACVARRLCEMCRTVIVGARSLSKEEKNFLPDSNISVFNVYDILDMPNWREKIRDVLSDNIYISIDLDVFDPAIMPSVGTPEPGGLGWYEFLEFILYITQYKNITGFDVVELCPIKNMVAPDFMAAKLIYRILGYIFLLNDKRFVHKKDNNAVKKEGNGQ